MRTKIIDISNTSQIPNKDREYEKCANCNKQTDIPIDMHIDLRECYIEGAGQLCRECYFTIYKKVIKKEND